MFPASTFSGKKIAVFGLARSGISCARALVLGGADVQAWDDSEPAQEQARAEGIPVVNLHGTDFSICDALVLSPGVPLTHPEPHWTVVKARAAGIPIIGDTEVFAREAAAAGSKIVAITGTNGKSTTTALIGHVLKQGGLDVEVGGNIGLAVFNLGQPVANRIYVLELSSFQIDLMPGLHPYVGVLTNLTPDHLDRHGTMENYSSVKGRMFANVKSGDTALVSVDDDWSRAIADRTPRAARLRRVSVTTALRDGICVLGGTLHDMHEGIERARLNLSGMRSLRGQHNWQNAAMAYGTATAFGLSTVNIESGFSSFPGLQHRMQEVARLGSVSFINDSKATNADAAAKALSSYDDIFWIAGGISKVGGIESLAPLFPRIKKAYLIGIAAQEFAMVLDGRVDHLIAGSLEEAVAMAAQDAGNMSGAMPSVVLSPACASFDQFKNFEVRGDAFVAAVRQLPGVQMQIGDN